MKLFTAIVCCGLCLGCVKSKLPNRIFLLHAPEAKYPVMLSKGEAGSEGKKLDATGGLRDTYRQANAHEEAAGISAVHTIAVSTGSVSSTILYRAEEEQCSWVQIDGAEFKADDDTWLSSNESTRTLEIKATGYQE